MSTIRKKPYIESVVESLTDEYKATLKTILNSNTGITNASFSNIPNAGITAVEFVLDSQNTKTGIFIRNATHCCLIAYHRFQDLLIYKIDLTYHTYEKINEYCDINELRRILTDSSESSGNEWVETMKNIITYDSENEEVQCNKHYYCDGDVETDGDVVVGRDLVVDAIENIQNTDGDAFIPAPFPGKYLRGTSNGKCVWDTPSNGIELVTKADWDGGEIVPLINTIYVIYDTDGSAVIKYFTS